MKKILSVLFLAIFLSSGFATAKVYFEPQWSEFAPQYALTSDLINKTYVNKHKRNYWNARLKHFEERKNFCKQQIEKDECYKELRELEQYLTVLYFTYTNYAVDSLPGYEE